VKTNLLYGNKVLDIQIPDNTVIYESSYSPQIESPEEVVLKAIRNPIQSLPLKEALNYRRSDDVVIVVSDITRPIPYSKFLTKILNEVESAGVQRESIVILIATGMHRPNDRKEQEEMFGRDICKKYRIVNHFAAQEEDLIELPNKSRSGNRVKLNRYFVQAGFRIVTGLVEPHFMAGFSGGRKAICPGLVSLESIRRFHGYTFLSNPNARNGNLTDNPCHEEALSIAQIEKVDFSINVVLNKKRQLVQAFAGELEAAHLEACKYVRKYACPSVNCEYDVVLTSSGGYPLDATFYQCVKGMVSCLPLVKEKGTIISLGECREGIGSSEYTEIMLKYANNWQHFLKHIKNSREVKKDQWQLQMQTRVYEKIGQENLYFITHCLPKENVTHLGARGIVSTERTVKPDIQKLLGKILDSNQSMAVLPEGPYCAPISV
jgi:nickel-dependent lactate racemase